MHDREYHNKRRPNRAAGKVGDIRVEQATHSNPQSNTSTVRDTVPDKQPCAGSAEGSYRNSGSDR